MIRMLLLLLVLAVPRPAAALTEAEAEATNFQTALDLCLTNYHDAASFLSVFETAGFALNPYFDQGTFEAEAFGVFVLLTPEDFNNTCMIAATGSLSHAQGNAIVQSTAARLFGDKVEQGHPENKPTECPMLSIFAPRRLIIVEVLSGGNAGGCPDPNSVSVLVR